MSKSIEQTYLIEAPIEKVWQALVDPKVIDEWGGGPVKMDEKVGTKFEFWGGDIYGINTKVEAPKLLEQDWFGGDWKVPSKVIFELTFKDGQTKLLLTHKDLPEDEVDNFDAGWREFYLGPIKELLESE